jgi:hypothetical protein
MTRLSSLNGAWLGQRNVFDEKEVGEHDKVGRLGSEGGARMFAQGFGCDVSARARKRARQERNGERKRVARRKTREFACAFAHTAEIQGGI